MGHSFNNEQENNMTTNTTTSTTSQNTSVPPTGTLNTGSPMMSKPSNKAKIIKRYQNRKLYDTQQSCYVTLDDIAKMIRADEEVMVIDNKTKNNITAATLTQIIFEAEKRAAHYAPLFTLREVIQNGNGSISAYLARLGAFPEEYIQQEQVQVQVETKVEMPKPSFDDVKQSLENRVATAAEKASETTNLATGIINEQTPSLPNSNNNKGLNM